MSACPPGHEKIGALCYPLCKPGFTGELSYCTNLTCPPGYLAEGVLCVRDAHIFAALIGGDLGPRFLPTGSLAGLLWLDLLRRHAVDIRLRQFVGVGTVVTVPALAVSLAILALY